MARVVKPIRGIAILDPDWTPDNLTVNDGGATNTGSDYTEADPEPGIAEVFTDSGYSILGALNQGQALVFPVVNDAQSGDLEFRTVRAGFPAGWSWKEPDDDEDISWRGWNRFNCSLASGGILQVGGAAESYENFYGVAFKPSTQLIMLVAANPTDNDRVRVWDPATRAWSSPGGTIDGSLVDPLQVVYFEDTNTWIVFEIQVSTERSRAWFSVDDGLSWALYSNDLWTDGIPVRQGYKTTLVDRFGNAVLCSSQPNGATRMHRSEDRGATWTRYHNTAAGGNNESASICKFSDDTILFAYRTSADGLEIKILPDGFTDPDDVTGVEVQAAGNVDPTAAGNPVVCWIGPDDTAWVAWRENTSESVLEYAFSTDRGATWTKPDEPMIRWTQNNSTAIHAEDMRMVISGGEGVMIHTATVSTSTTLDKSLWYTLWGGWSNVEVGVRIDFANARRQDRRCFGSSGAEGHWLPQWEDPPACDWTLTGTAGAVTINGFQISTAAATGYYTISSDSGSSVDGVLCFWEITVTTGGSISANDVVFRATIRNGTTETDVAVRHSTTAFVLHDIVAASDIGSSVSLDLTSATQFMLYFNEPDEVILLYKRPSSDLWLEAARSTSLSTNATASQLNDYEFGHRASTTSLTRWRGVAYAEATNLRYGLTDSAPVDPLDFGAPLTALPWSLRDQGTTRARTKLSAVGGPARIGRLYKSEAQGGGRVENFFPTVEPSPAVKWTGTDETVHDFVLDLRGAETRFIPSWAILVYVENACFQAASLASAPDAGTPFTVLGTLNLAIGFETLSYLQEGDILYPDTGNEGDRYVAAGELVDGYVLTTSNEAVRIVANTAGYWGNDELQMAVQLEDSTALVGATLSLVWPRGAMIIPLDGVAADYARYWRFRIGAQDAPDNVLSLGDLFVGGVLVPGQQWSRGFLTDSEPNIGVREDPFGTRRQRQRGPNRRRLTLAWTDGHDYTETRIHEGADFLSAGASTAPLALNRDVARQVDELFRYSKGGELPVVALLQDMPSTVTTITDPSVFLSGWLEGTASHEHIEGDEGVSELLRTQSIAIVERK